MNPLTEKQDCKIAKLHSQCNSNEKNHIKKAQKFWSKKYGREVSEGEVEEIDRNLLGFFKLLLKWSQEDKKRQSKASNSIETK